MAGKTWRWLRVRITGLLADDSRLARAARADLAATP